MTEHSDEIGEVHPNVLARWLVLHGYAEDVRGYGHVTGEDLAEALLATYEIRPRQPGISGRTEVPDGE